MLSVYFLIGVFGLSVAMMIVALILTYKWFNEYRGGLGAILSIIMFIVACISGFQAFWRLEAIDKAIDTEQFKQQR